MNELYILIINYYPKVYGAVYVFMYKNMYIKKQNYKKLYGKRVIFTDF